ncbi:MAG: polyhydroxyalkanoic acid system family protein [Planctomycetes bacterium]|nr:polyhydroxyalkanoic acid system family protein [Planctomycetota bacterium]
MPKFGVTVPHNLTTDEACSRLERFVEVLQQKFEGKVSDLQQSWDGDTLNFSFKTFGIQLTGGIAVTDNELKLDGDLPFAAMMFRGKIESDIKEQLERIVAA